MTCSPRQRLFWAVTMTERRTVGVRYCGGCNPRYDRVSAMRALAARCPDVEFIPAAPGQNLVLLLCGWCVQCARRDDLEGEILVLWRPEHYDQALRRLSSRQTK